MKVSNARYGMTNATLSQLITHYCFRVAHNIEDIARSVASYEVTETDLKRLQKELTQVMRGNNLVEDHQTIQFVSHKLTAHSRK